MEGDPIKDGHPEGGWTHVTRNGHGDAKAWYMAHHRYHGPKVNYGRMFAGVMLVFFGLAFLGRALGWITNIDIRWSEIWPLFVIAAGLSMMSGRGWISALVGLVVTLAVISLVMMVFIFRIGF